MRRVAQSVLETLQARYFHNKRTIPKRIPRGLKWAICIRRMGNQLTRMLLPVPKSPRQSRTEKIGKKIFSIAPGGETKGMTSSPPENTWAIAAAVKLPKTSGVKQECQGDKGKQELHPDRSGKTSNEQTLKKLKEEIKRLNAKIKKLEEQLEKLKEENKEELRKKEQELQEKEKEIEELKREKENAQHELQQQDQENKTLTARIEELEEEIERLKAEIKELKEEIQRLNAKIKKLEEELKKLKEENEEELRKKEQEIQEREKEIEELKRKEKDAQNKLQQQAQENIILIEELKEEIKRLNVKIKKLEEEVEKLKDENEEIKGNQHSLFLAAMCDQLQKNFYQIVFYPHDFSKEKQSYQERYIENAIKYGRYGLKTEKDKDEARERWENLKEKLDWHSELHVMGIRQLKYYRIPTAHPEITKDMKERLEDGAKALNHERKLDEDTFGIVQNLIKMWLKTEDLVQEQEEKKNKERTA